MSKYEYEVDVPPLWEGDKRIVICVDKIGGGTLGSSYTGLWKVLYIGLGDMHEKGELHTGTPKTHAEVAKIFADFLSSGWDTETRWPIFDRVQFWVQGYAEDLDSTDENE